MAGRSVRTRRSGVVLAVLAVAALALPVTAQSQLPLKMGTSSGKAGCFRASYPTPGGQPGESTPFDMACGQANQWSLDIPWQPNWQFTNARELSGSTPPGIAYFMKASETGSMDLDPDPAAPDFLSGGFRSLHLIVDLATEIDGGGESRVDQTFAIPFGPTGQELTLAGTASVEAAGDDQSGGDTEIQVSITCGSADPSIPPASFATHVNAFSGSGEPPATDSQTIDMKLATGNGVCSMNLTMGSVSRRNTPIDGGAKASTSGHLDLTISAAPAACDLAGTVFDGNLVADQHANKLGGLPVSLVKPDNSIAATVSTDSEGHYCMPVGTPGNYTLRASLVDGARSPALFKTVHAGQAGDVVMDRAVTPADVGRDDLDIEFTQSPARPWLADVANIHWQSTRFVDWLTGPLGIAPATIGAFTISTFDRVRTSYSWDTHVAHITSDPSRDPNDSLYKDRDTALDEGPEGLEWHEIGHRVAQALGIADTNSTPCTPRIAHGGWQNASTCDSLQEGFATFLPILASLDIDGAALGPGYATPEYADHGISLEANTYEPTSTEPCSRPACPLYREDFAVAQLLWDLVDGQASPNTDYAYKGVRDPDNTGANVYDEVTIAANDLLGPLLGATTVADLYAALESSSIVPPAIKAKSVDITGDGRPDVSKLDAVFLMHGFHASRYPDSWYYTLGDPIGSTDHAATGTGSLGVIREKAEAVPGSAISLVNPTSSELTFTIDVDYTTTTSHFEVSVDPGSEYLFNLELPPYWHGLITSPEDLPECTEADEHMGVTVAIAAPGITGRTFSNCEYLRAVATTATGYAMNVGGQLPSPTATPSPGQSVPATGNPTLLLAGGAGALILLAAVGFFTVRRRRRTPR